MVVTFKKKELSNDVYEPSNGEVYEPDETANPKAKNGKIEYKFPQKLKKDEGKDGNETKCQKAKMYVTLTNLLNPLKNVTLFEEAPIQNVVVEEVATPRLLQAQASRDNLATFVFGASETGDNAFILTFSALFSVVLLFTTLTF